MSRLPRLPLDLLNIGILLVTCVLAHLYPYHLLILSYAVLGPAHYLTQISWLHDRRYFGTSAFLGPVLAILSLVLLALLFTPYGREPTGAALVLSLAIGLSAIWVLPPEKPLWRRSAVAGTLLFMVLVYTLQALALFIVTLVPTVLHVFVFTAVFMLVGARKTRSWTGYLSVLVLLLGAGSFLIPPANLGTIPTLEGLAFFQPVTDYLQQGLGLSDKGGVQLFGFLSFAYTYHYLNWFSKAEIIRWNHIPPRRLKIMAAVYVAALALYAVNYTVGFLFIFLLSILHVLMEFPLNLRSFWSLARGQA